MNLFESGSTVLRSMALAGKYHELQAQEREKSVNSRKEIVPGGTFMHIASIANMIP